MDTNRLKRFATEARNILMQGVVHRLSALGFLPDGSVTEEPQQRGGGATFMGDTVTQDFYDKWQSLHHAVTERSIAEVAEEAAYTWFNRLVAIRILVKNGLASPVLEYESEDVLVPLLVSEARQGRMPEMDADSMRKLTELLDDDSKTNEQFALLIVAYCHEDPIINKCFGRISDYTELLLPTNILTEGGFVYLLNHTDFITDADYHSPELIGWLYQFYISERKDEVFAKKGKFEADEIPAATQIFTPNWIVKYMVQNTVGRIYLDNNPYETELQEKWQYLVEPAEKPSADNMLKYDELTDLRVADLACGSGHILNECFDLLYDLYIAEGYGRGKAIENIFRHNLTGVDLDTRAKQLATFALLLKACQKDNAFADAHCLPNVLDMTGVVPKMNKQELSDACLRFIGGYENVAGEMLEQDFELLRDADNLGSIMKFNDDEDYLAMLRDHYDDWTDGGTDDCPEEIQALIPGVRVILALTEKYHALVMNPPYMGSGNMNATISKYVKDEYEEGKADLFSVFMLLAIDRLLPNGKYGMINMQSWMFLSSFEKLRTRLLTENRIDNMLHLGPRTFDELSGEVVQNTSFVITNCEGKDATGEYYRLVDGKNCGDKERMFLEARENDGNRIYYPNVSQHDFEKIPGCPIGYWVSEKMLNAMTGIKISEYGISDGQNITGDNNKYLRLLWEVDYTKAGKGNKWVPMAKGGSFRRWYGNIDTVVNWSSTARNEYKQNPVARIQDEYLWYRTGITWNLISSGNGTGFRLLTSDTLFNKAAPTIVVKKEYENMANYVLAYLNTYVTRNILKIMNPTFNTNIAEVFNLAIKIQGQERVTELADQNISISKQDWDAHETSWDFETNPLLAVDEETYIDNIHHEIERHKKETGERICIDSAAPELDSLEWRMQQYKQKWEHLFMQLHENEEELNHQFIDIYGLQDELTPDVPLDEITILQQGEIWLAPCPGSDSMYGAAIEWNEDVVMKQFISYAVGCMMGRYRLDKKGLHIAHPNPTAEETAPYIYNNVKFEIDEDGIIPLMPNDSGFSDNASNRFADFVRIALGDAKHVENLNYVEKCLGKSVEQYFVKDFWKDHKKMYQNRPIYWLFASKKGAFQCIAYMHRMNAYTAERIRTKYLLPHIEWLMQKQSEMEENAANLSTAERKKLDSIRKQIAECREYHDRLHVVADEQIAFDLDDGVVVNYAKFGDVLAKLK